MSRTGICTHLESSENYIAARVQTAWPAITPLEDKVAHFGRSLLSMPAGVVHMCSGNQSFANYTWDAEAGRI